MGAGAESAEHRHRHHLRIRVILDSDQGTGRNCESEMRTPGRNENNWGTRSRPQRDVVGCKFCHQKIRWFIPTRNPAKRWAVDAAPVTHDGSATLVVIADGNHIFGTMRAINGETVYRFHNCPNRAPRQPQAAERDKVASPGGQEQAKLPPDTSGIGEAWEA